MYLRILLLFFGVLAISSSAAATCANSSACTNTKAKTPRDVSKFINRRDVCDVLRGEIPDPDPNDPERAKDIRQTEQEINRACKGTDADLASLKRRYSKNPVIMKKLNSYEEHIEAKAP